VWSFSISLLKGTFYLNYHVNLEIGYCDSIVQDNFPENLSLSENIESFVK
jgi:hypothetical protein